MRQPQPPDLAAVVRRGSFDLNSLGRDSLVDVDCWNGRLLITSFMKGLEGMVRCPLHPATHTTILPPCPNSSIHGGFTYYYHEFLLNRGARYGLSFFFLAIARKEQQSVLDVYVLQDDIWAICSSAVTEIKQFFPVFGSLTAGDKIYNLSRVSGTYKLFSLDLLSSCLSLVDLPEEDSGVHFIYSRGSHLRIWLYKVDKNGLGNWLLIDTICLREIFANHMIPTTMFDAVGPAVGVHAAGDNSGFLVLDLNRVTYLLFDIKHKALKKVYEVTEEDRNHGYFYGLIPFMMVWPPKFPVMKEGCDPKQ
ncbi:hypothetical protein VPH35_132205 [Triticum aestivum]